MPHAPLLRRMRMDDVVTVSAIERASFDSGWTATAFERELAQNQTARYLVAEARGEDGARVIGFAGLWLMVDEAHVVTVAVAPEHRRKGLGRLLVHGLVTLARDHQMAVATLECRESNLAARRLYGEYGFYEVGVRKHYYSDNQEDAIIMTTEELGSPPYQRRLAALEARLRALFPGVEPEVAGA